MTTVQMVDGGVYPREVIEGSVLFHGGGCSYWASPLGSDSEKYKHEGYPCYAPWVHLPDNRRTSLYIGLKWVGEEDHELGPAVQKMVGTEEGYRRWLEWLAIRSPHNEAIIQGQPLGYNRFVQMNVDASGWLVHHTACALRIHQEHMSVPLYWMLYTKAGMEEDLAYLLALLTRYSHKKIVAGVLVSHAAISSSQAGCLAGFLLRRRKGGEKSWRESSRYSGHGSMWSDGRRSAVPRDCVAMRDFFPNTPRVKPKSIFDEPEKGGYPLTREGLALFVEEVGGKFLQKLCVKAITNPEPTGVKYERS